MRFAFADPPYLGHSVEFYSSHPGAAVFDTIEGHAALIEQLSEFDGWALHMTVPNLWDILPLCPRDARVVAWVKPFASFKPNVGIAYAWEPIIVRGGRKLGREVDTVRDWVAAPITLKRGLVGAKPTKVVRHVLALWGARASDEVVDMFPGSGAVSRAIIGWREAAGALGLQEGLFA